MVRLQLKEVVFLINNSWCVLYGDILHLEGVRSESRGLCFWGNETLECVVEEDVIKGTGLRFVTLFIKVYSLVCNSLPSTKTQFCFAQESVFPVVFLRVF